LQKIRQYVVEILRNKHRTWNLTPKHIYIFDKRDTTGKTLVKNTLTGFNACSKYRRKYANYEKYNYGILKILPNSDNTGHFFCYARQHVVLISRTSCSNSVRPGVLSRPGTDQAQVG